MTYQRKTRIINAAALVTGALSLTLQVLTIKPLTILDIVIILLLLNLFYGTPMFFYSREKQEDLEYREYYRHGVTGRTDYD